jgi:hypothetical protein
MNVKELKELLKDLPDEMPIFQTRCGGYRKVDKDDFCVKQVFDTGKGWFSSERHKISFEAITCFHIDGN